MSLSSNTTNVATFPKTESLIESAALEAGLLVPTHKVRTKALESRSFMNHQQRLEIIKKKDEEPKWTQVQLARWAKITFNLPKEPSQATIAVLLKKRDKLKAATVRPMTRTIRGPRYPQLEAALLLWVRSLQSKGLAFTGENIRTKAASLSTQLGLMSNLTYSTGWMSGFVSRHSLTLARSHRRATVDENEPIRSILRSYEPCNVFSMDETCLIYNDLPYDDSDTAHCSINRDRICLGLAVNMDGSEKCDPLIVSTSRSCPGIETYYNIDGKMTATIFERWLYQWNQNLAETKRSILLLVDTAPSHFPITLSHIRLVMLPVKSGQWTLPLVGITQRVKALYRKAHLSYAVDQSDDGQSPQRAFGVTITRAMRWIRQAWAEIPSDLIRYCWCQTSLTPPEPHLDGENVVDVAEIHPEIAQSLVVSLSQLQMLERVSLENLLRPSVEDNVHYVYDDATIVRVVTAESTVLAEDEAKNDNETLEEYKRQEMLDVDLKAEEMQSKMTARIPTNLPSSISDVLTHYRGVIQALDAEKQSDEEHTSVLDFLRRKEAALLKKTENDGHQSTLT